MNCPLCIDQTLMPNYRTGIEIDVCPQCKGVWLDRGEIDKLAAPTSGQPAVAIQPAPVVQDSVAKEKSKKQGKKQKKKKKSGLGDRLGDLLEDVLDL